MICTPKWTSDPKLPGMYIVRHYWEDGTQRGTDYLYRYVGEKRWVTLIGDTDKRITEWEWDEHARMRFFGPIPPCDVPLGGI